MINAGIPDGSLALIHSQSYAENGDIVACMVDEENATLKRFRKQGRTVMLIPENPHYDPIVLDASEFDPLRLHQIYKSREASNYRRSRDLYFSAFPY